MPKIDYISRHPMREFTKQNVTALLKDSDGNFKLKENIEVVIPVDSSTHNQDPFVFHYPWINAYCRVNSFKRDLGPQSIISWGAWNNDKSKFLIDTVFVVGKSFYWNGTKPNEDFMNSYPFKDSDPIYKFLFKYAKDKKTKKRILTANHNINLNCPLQSNRFDDFFSFIPLIIENGFFKPIDIVPFIDSYAPDSLSKIVHQKNGIKNIDFAFKLITYIYSIADILVVKCDDTLCHPKPDLDLQKEYYKEVYNAVYKPKKICSIPCNS